LLRTFEGAYHAIAVLVDEFDACGLQGTADKARVIDLDGVYNPCRPNDRLLLGMKGSISEFELGILRARMLDAARSKARRGKGSARSLYAAVKTKTLMTEFITPTEAKLSNLMTRARLCQTGTI
jgi:hypothetical protein